MKTEQNRKRFQIIGNNLHYIERTRKRHYSEKGDWDITEEEKIFNKNDIKEWTAISENINWEKTRGVYVVIEFSNGNKYPFVDLEMSDFKDFLDFINQPNQ